jgi:hypothetical protein
MHVRAKRKVRLWVHIRNVSGLREHVIEEENTTNTGREDGERTSKLLMHRYNYSLTRCYHKDRVKLVQVNKNIFYIQCLDCERHIFEWSKYSKNVKSVTEDIAKKVYVFGDVPELTDEEREAWV